MWHAWERRGSHFEILVWLSRKLIWDGHVQLGDQELATARNA
jgi:hypothetical protein